MAAHFDSWWLAVASNLCIAVAFAGIAYTALAALVRTRQARASALGVATAALFASCALGYASHGLALLVPAFGIDVERGMRLRAAVGWQIDAIDALTAGLAIWYWTLRPHVAVLLDGGTLFADLQRRFRDQSRALHTKVRLADTLQRALAPKELPTTAAVAFDAFYLPADDAMNVGGDWYDVFTLPDGSIAFSIGDVTGHGAEAAATTSRAREAIAAAAFADEDPASVLRRANRILSQRQTTIVTAIFGVVDARGLALTYATAGHPPPVIAAPNGTTFFGEYDGLALCIDADAAYRNFTYTLARGGAVVLYTDGVTESSRDLARGDRRLLEAVGRHVLSRSAFPAKPITHDTIGRDRPRDDMAVLVIKFLGDPVVVDLANGRRWTFDVKDAQAATRLRHEIVACIADRAPQTALFEAELIVGELLGNVVKHTPGLTEVVFDWSHASPILSVRDRGSRFEGTIALPEDDLAENGRGMFLIDALAARVEIGRIGETGNELRITLPTGAANADAGALPAVRTVA